jgi:zinc/manganese transport system permease protein
MSHILGILFAPGFFQNKEVINALVLGSIVAAMSGVIGVLVVLRRQSFAGHAISDFGGSGAAISFLIGINTLWGFLSFGVLAAICMEFLGKRANERDLATGIILSIALGLESLFLFLDTHFTGKASAPMLILFGSIFVVGYSTIKIIVFLTITVAIVICIIYRPLLMSSIDPELAITRGIPVRTINIVFIIILALIVEECSLITGSLLSTALLIGPAAAALHFTHKIRWTMLWSALIGIASMWLGIIFSYDSYNWPPYGKGWSVSFFVSMLVFLFYMFSRLLGRIFKDRRVILDA